LLAEKDALEDGRKAFHEVIVPLDIQTHISPKRLIVRVGSNLLNIRHDITRIKSLYYANDPAELI
jgi:hypothetical protein